MTSGGRCDFDDGGSYTGSWQEGMSHGHGVCTGPSGQGEYAGSWHFGFEVSGIYTWTSGNYYEGQWLQGKRHGLGVEKREHWLYRGEWTQGFKGRYGIRQSMATGLKFEGTWTSGLQDGYGVETYADGGTYQGQWLRGLRHGYGVRQSVSYDLASRYQAAALPSSTLNLPATASADEATLHDRDRRTEENRGGFVLLDRTTPSEDAARKKRLLLDKHGRPSIRKTIANELRLIRQKSTGDIQEQPPRSGSRQSGGSVRSTASAMTQSSATSGRTTASVYSDDDVGSFVSQVDLEQGGNVVERYLGEWKNDKRSGFGICERSDGLKYEGEWSNNKKYGFGVTTLRDGSRLEGKYKNNVLVTSGRSSKLFILRSSKVRDRVESAVLAAHKAADFAKQKADIANARMTSARVKCEQAEDAAKMAVADAEQARIKARDFSPNSDRQSGEKIIANRLQEEDLSAEFEAASAEHPPPPLQSQQSPKKFSFFKFKKDASLRAKNEALPRSAAVEPLASVTPKSALKQNSLSPQGTLSTPLLYNAPYRQSVPPQTNTHIINDFRSAQQMGYQDGATVTGQMSLGRGQVPFDRGQVPFDRGQAPFDRGQAPFDRGQVTLDRGHGPPDRSWAPAEGAWTQTQSGLSPGGLASDATLHGQPEGALPTSQGHGFDDSYNWMGYGEVRERRKSLPSIVKDKKDVPSTASGVAKTAGVVNNPQTPTRTMSPVPQPRPHVDTYVIEDGVRKRLKPLYADLPRHVSLSAAEKGPQRLPQKLYELEPPKAYRQGEKGSMPDVSVIRDSDVLPREAVYVLSQQRREALMMERAEEERRRRNQIVFRLGDLKDWCERRQVLVFVLALNISLATVFYSMLQ